MERDPNKPDGENETGTGYCPQEREDADARCLRAIIEDAIAHGVDPMAFEEHNEPCCKFDPSTGQLRCQCNCHGEYKEHATCQTK